MPKKMADNYITKSKKALAKFPDGPDKEDLLSLADLIFDRQN